MYGSSKARWISWARANDVGGGCCWTTFWDKGTGLLTGKGEIATEMKGERDNVLIHGEERGVRGWGVKVTSRTDRGQREGRIERPRVGQRKGAVQGQKATNLRNFLIRRPRALKWVRAAEKGG